MAHVGDIRGSAVLELVRDRLDRYPGEHTRGAFWNGPRTVQTLDECRMDANHQFDIRLERGVWGDDPETIARSRRTFVFHHVQHHPDRYRSSSDWRGFLAASDTDDWSSWARSLDDDGRHVHASAAAATARWFDRSRSMESILGARSPEVQPLVDLPRDDSFPALPFADRHWRAWAAKNHGYTYLPVLVEHECDESFSIRTRIYRSLGQIDHLAAVPVLREGLHDRHPFARAQAVRALGWLYEPTTVDALRAIARRDGDADVRRSAERAVQRIVGYWMFYGEWNDVAGSPSRAGDVMHHLASHGLAGFALEVPRLAGIDVRNHPALIALRAELAPHTLDSPLSRADRREYHSYFPDARRDEATVDGADLSTIDRWLDGDEPDRIRALDVVGRHRLRHHLPRVAAVADAPGGLGWTARRTLRRLGHGAWLPVSRLVELT